MKLTRATHRTEVALDRIGEVLKALIRVQADEKVDDIETLQYAYELHLVTTETNRAQHGLLLTDKGNDLLRDVNEVLVVGIRASGKAVPANSDPKPVYTVKLETDDLGAIKAMVDDGATLVLERGGGRVGWMMKKDSTHYLVIPTSNGIMHTFTNLEDAWEQFEANQFGRQIYVDYPIPQHAGKAAPKSSVRAREELKQAKNAIGPNTAISHIIKAVEALIEDQTPTAEIIKAASDKARDEIISIIEEAIKGSAK